MKNKILVVMIKKDAGGLIWIKSVNRLFAGATTEEVKHMLGWLGANASLVGVLVSNLNRGHLLRHPSLIFVFKMAAEWIASEDQLPRRCFV